MKRFLTAAALILASIALFPGNSFAKTPDNVEILPAITSESSTPNRIWAGTFQLVWNEMIDEIIKKPVKFAGYSSEDAKQLNKKTFKKSDISDDSYYVKSGTVSPDLKTEIETAIKEKFNETSDILDAFDWTYDPQKLFIYAMLKKDFKFLTPFDKLPQNIFAQNHTPIEYFGINEDSNRKLYKNVSVMFYNANNDFAVKLLTKSKDVVILYRTDDEKTFAKYFDDINEKNIQYKDSRNFNRYDKLAVPDLNLYLDTDFPDLEGHRIKGTNFVIDKTIETVDFKMNNEGVKLKSEAALMMKCMAMPVERGRYFNFTDKYVLFLIERGKQTPYYAMRISDVETLNKTRK